jgi:hypothetical protein
MVSHLGSLSGRIERKFFVAPSQIEVAYGLLRHICRPDGQFPSELINSLYFDTSGLDEYQRAASGEFLKNKVRIRWYDREEPTQEKQTVFVELKSRQGFVSTKQRHQMQIASECLSSKNLGRGIVSPLVLLQTLAGFGYFASELLQPVIRISYWRYRFADIITGQRVALDCHIRSTVVIPGTGDSEKDLELDGGVIEIKGESLNLPPTLMQLRMLETDWTQFSKYSACLNSHFESPGSIGRFSPSGRIARL